MNTYAQMRQAGFTLLEMLAVMAIVALVAGVLIAWLIGFAEHGHLHGHQGGAPHSHHADDHGHKH